MDGSLYLSPLLSPEAVTLWSIGHTSPCLDPRPPSLRTFPLYFWTYGSNLEFETLDSFFGLVPRPRRPLPSPAPPRVSSVPQNVACTIRKECKCPGGTARGKRVLQSDLILKQQILKLGWSFISVCSILLRINTNIIINECPLSQHCFNII
jgi:hypothetical protein